MGLVTRSETWQSWTSAPWTPVDTSSSTGQRKSSLPRRKWPPIQSTYSPWKTPGNNSGGWSFVVCSNCNCRHWLSRYAYKTEIRSVLEHSSRPTSTLWVNMLARYGQKSIHFCSLFWGKKQLIPTTGRPEELSRVGINTIFRPDTTLQVSHSDIQMFCISWSANTAYD